LVGINGIKLLILIWLRGDIKWFTEAKLNITKNCIDRHLNKEDKTAIIFEPNNPAEEALHITYTDLHQRVCKMANV
jgi:acetyl-CoA synthetase